MTEWLTAHWLEIFGAFAGIVYVMLEIRQSIWLWPVGIVTSAVYVLVFFSSKFYADMSLQVYYLVISFYGWYIWRYGVNARPAPDATAPASPLPDVTGTNIPRHLATVISQPSTREAINPSQSPEAPASPSLGANAPDITAPSPITPGPNQSQNSATTGSPTHDIASPNQNPSAATTGSPTPAGAGTPLPVTRTPLRHALILATVYVILHAVMWYILANYTDSPVAGWDSFTTAVSVIATWMLARKYLEHWILWIIVNIVSLILYIYKGLYPTTVLFLVYTVMAFIGYREWKSQMLNESDETTGNKQPVRNNQLPKPPIAGQAHNQRE